MVGACSAPPNDSAHVDAGSSPVTTTRTDTCASQGFRSPNPHGVVCPGTPTCLCEAPQICCMQKIDGNQGTCGTYGSCRAIAFTCNGPEACGGDGGVCCFDQGAGGGSFCASSATTCMTHKILCRGDSDCASVPGMPFCRPADFGTQGVADRGLDGLIGVCSNQ
jgi:hypothetical protein